MDNEKKNNNDNMKKKIMKIKKDEFIYIIL